MTKLASEIVGIINSRNEYMEKQAGLVDFIAKKVIKPVSRFMFRKPNWYRYHNDKLIQKIKILRDVSERAARGGDMHKFYNATDRMRKRIDDLQLLDMLAGPSSYKTMKNLENKIGLVGGTGIGTYIGTKLTTPEPTLSDVFNNYMEKIR